MRVVLDSSFLFKAFAFRKVPLDILTAIQSSPDWEIVYSDELQRELFRVLEENGYLSFEAKGRMKRYFEFSTLVNPTTSVQICRDPTDDFILACAIESSADLIISDDLDLQVLSGSELIGGIEVIGATAAYRRFIGRASTTAKR